MARKVITVDDLDGSEGAETLRYSLDGQEYEIDLSEANAAKLRGALQYYIDKSRPADRGTASSPAGSRDRSRGRSAPRRSREELSSIRAWAESQGYEVAPRGRIKRRIIEEYDKAHG